MLIGQLITLDPNIAPLMRVWYTALDARLSDGISGRSTMVHGMDADVLVQQINDFLGE